MKRKKPPRRINGTGATYVEPRGYVKRLVGSSHHLANNQGWAYEHQLVAEKMLGRRLKPEEIVHHRDGDKGNNSPANIEVCDGHPEHNRQHLGKLTAKQVREIRRLYAYRRATLDALARRYGVNFQNVSRVVRGETHRSAGGPISRRNPTNTHAWKQQAEAVDARLADFGRVRLARDFGLRPGTVWLVKPRGGWPQKEGRHVETTAND